jgi:hypothetical protein
MLACLPAFLLSIGNKSTKTALQSFRKKSVQFLGWAINQGVLSFVCRRVRRFARTAFCVYAAELFLFFFLSQLIGILTAWLCAF